VLLLGGPQEHTEAGLNGRVHAIMDPPYSLPVRTVFSVDGSRYQHWQAELLAYSHRRVGQPGPLTRLWSATDPPDPFPGKTVRTTPWNPHPLTGDWYPPFNKPAAIQEWLSATCPEEEGVLLVDPDCIFLAPVAAQVERGRPVSQPMDYMNPDTDSSRELVARHCRRPALVQGVGIPTLIHQDDLRVLAPLWLAKTEAIRSDQHSRELAGWTAEMWAYMFAAAELGLTHELSELSVWPSDHRVDRPIVHYCYETRDQAGAWRWDKRDYQPWETVPPPPPGTPQAGVALISLLNEWATIRSICLEP
jgi:hypothetical protein